MQVQNVNTKKVNKTLEELGLIQNYEIKIGVCMDDDKISEQMLILQEVETYESKEYGMFSD